jgi:CRISPR-associated endonuclease/helicase Cas3
VGQDFEWFFERATAGGRPYEYLARIARAGLPDLVSAPTGTGKTGVILAWLWRRLHGPDPAGTPRRLIYALPQRALLDEVSASVRTWLRNLGLTDEVALHVVLGDRGTSTGDWRENMHQPAIVVGTTDTLVSKALFRGYGIGRAMCPIDFALVTNGAQWIIDDAELCPVATATLRQLAGWCGERGTAEPFGLTRLSSSLLRALPATAGEPTGTPLTAETITIAPQERIGDLAVRLGAARTIRRAAWAPGDYAALTETVCELYRDGTMTLVVLNTILGAQEVYRRLRDGAVACTLLHPQLRGVERMTRLADVVACPEGRIVVATGDVACGLDLSAAVLVTEATPWAAMVQRAGRCNRTGTVPNAEVWWAPPAAPLPPEQLAVEFACAELSRLEGMAVTGEELAARGTFPAADQASVVSLADLSALFDNSAALTDLDVDVSRYVKDAEDLDVDVAWVTWIPRENGAPDPEVRYPAPEYRCRVPIGQAVKLAASRPVWYFDPPTGEWQRAGQDPRWRPRPFELLLVDAADGGYDPATGFSLLSRDRVPESPELLTPDEIAARAAEATALSTAAEEAGLLAATGDLAPPAATGDAALPVATEDVALPVAAEDVAPRKWQSLDEHSEQVRDQAAALLAVLTPSIPLEVSQAAVIAAYLHDAGKAHPTWQDALCALADESEADTIAAGRPWAKSGTTGRLEFAGGVSFRHELASLLLVDGPLHDLLAGTPETDLARYLILAHHGRLRVRVGDPDELAVRQEILGLSQGATTDIPPMLSHPASTLTVDLNQFSPNGGRSWTATVSALRDRLGPFILAYLETLVRMADWRASGARDLVGNNNAIDITAKSASGTPD